VLVENAMIDGAELRDDSFGIVASLGSFAGSGTHASRQAGI
jgi:hypothetical protein